MHRPISDGFTLIELMIVVAIAAIATVLGFVSLTSRMKASQLEQAASQLESDLSYARSAALLKGCRTRIIFCNDRDCTAPDGVTAGACPTGGPSGCLVSGGEPASYYAVLRYSQLLSNSDACFSNEAVPGAVDGFDYWDFDRRPQLLPAGTALINLYGSDLPDLTSSDWNSSTSAEADSSLWFDTEGELHSPVAVNALVPDTSLPYRITFQVQHEDCLISDEDCLGFLVSIPRNGGTARKTRCVLGGPSALADGTNQCQE